MRGPKTLFVHCSRQLGGCEAYRMWLPCEELYRRGFLAGYMPIWQAQRWAAQATLAGQRGPEEYEVFVLPRGALINLPGLKRLKLLGKKLVFEVDDDFTNRHRQVIQDPALYTNIWDFARETCDAVTVSTPYLAQLMRRETGKPVHVLPNCVNWRMWQGHAKAKALTLGLSGSDTHGTDWRVLEPVLPEILREFPTVHLAITGFVPDYLKPLQQAYPAQVQVDPTWVDYRLHPARAARAHIVLCPVDPTDGFNRSKSGIKAIEGLAHGAAVVATDMNIYQGLPGVWLAHFRPEAWHVALRTLILDASLRAEMAAQGRRYVRRQHAIDQQWHLWQRAYREIWEH